MGQLENKGQIQKYRTTTRGNASTCFGFLIGHVASVITPQLCYILPVTFPQPSQENLMTASVPTQFNLSVI